MTGQDVAEVLGALDGLGVWIDGGWAVEALVPAAARPHGDLDLVVLSEETPEVVTRLEAIGFSELPKPDSRAENFVMADAAGREVDLHVIRMTDDGVGLYGPDSFYPAYAFDRPCKIAGISALCITPEYLLESRVGYAPRDVDHADVSALCHAFGLPAPEGYAA